jgi:phage shock protein A
LIQEQLKNATANEEALNKRVKEAERQAREHLDAVRALEGNATHANKRVQQLQTNADLTRQQSDSLTTKLAELTKENQKLEARLSDADRLGHERLEFMESVSKLKVG